MQVAYRYLLWYGPVAQQLSGRYSGPEPSGGRPVVITYRSPGGNTQFATVWTDVDGSYTLGVWPGDPYFGISEIGTWRAQAYDVTTGTSSNEVVWDVKWFIIRLKQ